MKCRGLSVLMLFVTTMCVVAQNNLEDLNIILHNDFEHNTLGSYRYDEWYEDWLKPDWNNRLQNTEIYQDTDDKVNPTKAMIWNYPAGSLGPAEGGGQWWTYIPKTDELYVSYDVMFMPGFDFAKGGKLPGINGGEFEGYDRPNGYDGFLAQLMFSGDGALRFYAYWTDSPSETYGTSFIWGNNNYSEDSFRPSQAVVEYASGSVSCIRTGEWHNIIYRVVLNSVTDGVANYDGILEGYFDGELVTQVSHILFRRTTELAIDMIAMVTFLGGNDDTWRNSIDQWLKIDNVLFYNYKDHVDVPRGNELSSTSRVIDYWRNYNNDDVVDDGNEDNVADNDTSDVDDNVADNPSDDVDNQEPPEEEIINNAPVIDDQIFAVKEDEFKNSFIGKIHAYDMDANQILTYSIASGNDLGLYRINSLTGELQTSSSEMFGPYSTSHNLIVKVTDNGQESLSSSASVKINLVSATSIVYINPDNKNDLKENGSKLHPFNSWEDVVWKDGYSYLQKRGTYCEVDKILIGANNLTIGSYGEGNLPIITSKTNSYLLCGYEKYNVWISDIQLKAENAASVIYFLGNNANDINIKHCILEGSSNAIRIVDGKNITISYNTLKGFNEAIYSTAATTNVYYNVLNNNNTAINITSSLSQANIYNNVFLNNTKSVSVSFSELKLYNNIFYLSSEGQKAIQIGTKKIASDNNIYFPEQKGFIEIAQVFYNNLELLQNDFKIDLHSFNKDPLFSDLLNEDFELNESSPAINAGLNLNLDKDHNGEIVPIADLPDIGAFESNSHVVVDVTDNSDNILNLFMFPNPSTGIVHLDIQRNEESLNASTNDHTSILQVFDLQGNIVYSKSVDETASYIQHELDLSNLINGFYFVVLRIAGKVVNQKLIINK